MLTITKKPLSSGKYFPKETPKKFIVLHHTVSSNENSPLASWENAKGHIGTAYIIAKDGKVIEAFNPKFNAPHIGNCANKYNEDSIGIEIVNEGILTRKSVGANINYNWTFGEYKGKVFINKTLWRGSYYFTAYTEEQIKAAAELCSRLCADFNIPKNVLRSMEFSPDNFNFKGILAHHNLRKDKSDVSPAFDYDLFIRSLN